jgi:hypothetical protein
MNTGYIKISDPRLKRYVPKDFEHVEKHPLTKRNIETITKPAPVSVGVNWYSLFDNPVKQSNGQWWIKGTNLGYIRGGHCVCMPHVDDEPYTWYTFYNQGMEGACVGFGTSRMMSILNRKKYNARWAWDMAKSIDEWNDTNPGDDEGTSVRAAMDIYRLRGHVPWASSMTNLTWQQRDALTPISAEGIISNKWATNIDDLFSVLQNETYKKVGAIPFFNSWGKAYPRKVWVPCETWDRLLREDGEFTMVLDK